MARWEINFNHRIDTEDKELITLSVEIESYRLSIMRIPIPPSKQRELDKINMIRQIKGTTGIEGNMLTEEEIRRVIESGQAKLESEKEAENAHRLQQFIRERVKSLGEEAKYITEDLIKQMHAINTEGLSSGNNIPGQYRRHDVSAGDYQAPHYGEIEGLMRAFIEVINSNEVIYGLGPLIRSIIAHFYLITIHPFGDGNGRTSRALEAYILYAGGYNVRGFYSLANYHYRHRDDYIDQLNKARFVYNGNLTPFIKYCLRAFLHELEGVQESILEYVRRVMYKDYVIEELQLGRINSRMMTVIDFLLDGGRLTSDEYRNKRHRLIEMLYEGLTAKTAQRDLNKMLERGLVIEREKRLYANVDILNKFIE
ncbi:hypothetical protein DNHGIG_07680 [Collibacillus ludicampi]|uniref:Fido domain-containing protein n=1 Tax=Collibacillus ludicampi TaxID=2771369 RepID=A0AAV4LBZ2_9BACL|nr:Fic family protein [Collibacillus ludicampi]GIM45219.1 hypothetical protein DNHGIG_07680 [Collibacillus ludicampi]